MRDLGRGEPAEQPERQRHLGGGAEGRVAAGEDEPQPVIPHRALLLLFFVGVQQRGLRVLAVAGRLAAQPVDGPVARGGDDPSDRTWRQPSRRPPPGRLGERVLDRVLGDVDGPDEAGQDGYRAAVHIAEDLLDVGQRGHGQG